MLKNISKGFASKTMRAAIVSSFGAPENIKVENGVEEPTLHDPSQVLIDVHCAGVNPVDTYMRSGVYARLPTLPYVPGRDGAGIVRQIGEKVSTVKVGDKVSFYDAPGGASAETTVADAAKVFSLAPGISMEEGACLGVPYLTAFRALFHRGLASKGDRILVHGASGGVGIACCQLGKDRGAIVVGTAGSHKGIDLIKKNGAELAFNHRKEGYVDEMKKAVPEGFNVIVEMLANVNLPTDLSLLCQGGRVVIVGNRGECTINPRLLMQKESSVLGVMLGGATESDLSESMSHVKGVLERNAAFRPVVSRVYSLDQLPQAHHDILSPPNGAAEGNIVVRVRDTVA